MIKYIPALLLSTSLFAGGEECINLCTPPAAPKPKCPKAKVITKTVVKTVEKIVEKPVEKIVEKEVRIEPKKNTISLVLGGGIDRSSITPITDSVYEIQPESVFLFGPRYSRTIGDDYELGIQALSTYKRISSYKALIETADVSFGVKF
jgi:hypothetical protein